MFQISVSDVTDKMFEIAPNKVAVGAGVVAVLDNMREHVEKKVSAPIWKQICFPPLNGCHMSFYPTLI